MSLRVLRRHGRVVRHAFEMALRQNFTDAFVLFAILVQPLIIAVLAFWMLRERGGDYVIFVVVGSGMSGLWSSLLFISGNSITQERWTGTLEALVAMPTPVQVVVFGKNLANVVQSLGSMAVCYTLAMVFFGYAPQIGQPFLFIVSLVLTVISFVTFGLVIASLFILTPEIQNFQNGLEFPVFILSGFLFPIALLPDWTTPLSYLLAPYWAARAVHASSTVGAPVGDVYLSWGMMLTFSLLYVLLSSRMFRVLIRKARTDATLSRQ